MFNFMFLYINIIENISELGEGWKPSILESEDEYDFVREGQKGLCDLEDYFIGGSVYPDFWWTIFGPFIGAFPQVYNNYSPTQAGNLYFKFKQFSLNTNV